MIMTLIILFGMACLAVEIAYHSSLAYDIKHFFGLTEDHLAKISVCSTFKFWRKFLPVWLLWLSPLPILILKFFHKFIELINCPFCISAWVGFFTALFLKYNIIESLGLAGVTVFFVYIIQAVQNHVES